MIPRCLRLHVASAVARAIGRATFYYRITSTEARPGGELADFLGSQVVKAFWQGAQKCEPTVAAAD